jgi:putative FmdB family regulatory protein
MPLYDFKCTNKDCEYEFEEQVKLADIDDCGCVDCPECHMPAIRKITNPRHYKHVSWSAWKAGE